ncbi:hypothetical protein DFJ58DRAFT_850203 [Suillus subalutaceus]|uniref:uncharacterized protein n=1 Tax=Suillus subalutaceus TaxID=48586 RepID=UPI001B87FECD|nr:uncharacterized protein DFJ58DRAFT_850203 [Suillus subalutaceus]KAG1819397.1 hypothetical protein DFJ58DRAFT_850203 [Suillus subalutaceus]
MKGFNVLARSCFKLEAPENTYGSDPEFPASHKLEEEFRPADDDGEDEMLSTGEGLRLHDLIYKHISIEVETWLSASFEDVTLLQRLRAQQYHKLKIPFNDWIQPLEKRRSQWRPKSTRGHALSIETSIGVACALLDEILKTGKVPNDIEDLVPLRLAPRCSRRPWPCLHANKANIALSLCFNGSTPNITHPYISQISKARGFFNIFGDGNCIAAFKMFEFKHGNFVVPFVFKLRRNSWPSMPKLRLQYGVPRHGLGAIATPTDSILCSLYHKFPPLHLPNQYDADIIQKHSQHSGRTSFTSIQAPPTIQAHPSSRTKHYLHLSHVATSHGAIAEWLNTRHHITGTRKGVNIFETALCGARVEEETTYICKTDGGSLSLSQMLPNTVPQKTSEQPLRNNLNFFCEAWMPKIARTNSNSLARRFSSQPSAAHQHERTKNAKTKRNRELAVMPGQSTRPVPPVRLRKPMACFSIPLIRAELVMDESLTNLGTLITYSAPQEVVAVDFDTRMEHTTCRVPVMEGGQLRGYVPLPMRYRDVWLELSYNIVLLINIWRLWSKEEGKALNSKEKKMATTCRQNAGTLLVQYMLARLLAVEELVGLNYNTDPGEERVKVLNEWKVRMVRDWFYMTYSEAEADGPEFLHADPVSLENKAFFERKWDIEEEGRDIMSLPADTNLWIHGRIEGFDDAFEKTIKPQSFEEMSKPSQFFETRYEEGAKLPSRWHEGHEPRPLFWSIKQWDWFRNDYWNAPIDFLRYALVTEPAYHDVGQFLGDLRSLSGIISLNPNWQDIEANAKDLWLGKMIWREFVDSLSISLSLSEAETLTSEKRDDRNPFNTLEARLIFEGYVHREKPNSKDQVAEDNVLWQSLDRISPPEHRPVWEWVASEMESDGVKVTCMLKQAGDWWREFRHKQARNSMMKKNGIDGKVDLGKLHACRMYQCARKVVNAWQMVILRTLATPSITLAPGGVGDRPPESTAAADSNDSNEYADSTHPPLPIYSPMINGVSQILRPIHLGLSRYLDGYDSLETFGDSLIKSFPSEYEASIRQFVNDLQPFTVEQFTVDVAEPILDSFVRRVNAIQAKKEAEVLHKEFL